MRYVYNDGGRSVSGFRGDAGDCLARFIASSVPYKQVYQRLAEGIGTQPKESRKSPQWASFGAGGLVQSLPQPETFA
jgi:hypothetical protein